jgi:hypothetical protein
LKEECLIQQSDHMELVEVIPLPNDFAVEVWDQSRPIASNTSKVDIFFRMKVDLDPSYFIKPEHYQMVKKVFGPQIFFEYRMERAFVNNREKDAAFQELLTSFKKVTLPYLSRPAFPRSLAISKHRDIEKNPYKYRLLFQNLSI